MSLGKTDHNFKVISEALGSIVMPSGFKAGAVYCGLKTDPASFDIGIVFSETPCTTAALFTKNLICAAPVKFSQNVLKNGDVSAIVVNSGNANACTGDQGHKDTEKMAEITAECLGVGVNEVMVASTGIIGHVMPMDKVTSGIKKACEKVDNSRLQGQNFAKSILTTDKIDKEAAVEVKGDGYSFTIGGISKGSGMIEPNMATMLSFITTDATISKETLNTCLKKSVDKSFNKITVDGHTSTNDMVSIMANGADTNGKEIKSDADILVFQEALDYVTMDLAKKIVLDGEGATKFIQIDVNGARSSIDADKIARAVANSPLVKTAINGEDCNWGRIVSAAGYSGGYLDESCLKLFVNRVLTFKNGAPVEGLSSGDESFINSLNSEMQKSEILISLELGLGTEKTTMWTCDFSHEYITINAEYHT